MLRNINLLAYNTYKVNATAELVAIPENENELISHLQYIGSTEFAVIGGGSNIILSKPDYRFPLIVLTEFNRFIRVEGNHIIAGAGVSLSSVVEAAVSNGLWGLEKLIGIPGTLGGAVYMNAGAYGQDIGSSIEWVESLDIRNHSLVRRTGEELGFSYRHSDFVNWKHEIICSVKIALTDKAPEGENGDIRSVSLSTLRTRLAKLPYDLPNAGSVFKRPDYQYPVGKMVEDLGMKGRSVNGAMVSHMHAGIIVNTGFATGSDIQRLATEIRGAIKKNYGLDIEMEQIVL
ncbi:UDP-N-acetylmuramate dehydrogenase [Hahella aquimaris]|uniref:UDP-N-acetylmuramate dehydrogenase n=1 Tax=Hahella sp. HNIBRBA332 TaxID=3015983 RepID=UPI00273CE64B|nr:UDP-N-acetylmuramate dehydrogenase [Hahella sp. HNIBRBA332]WLQ17416.1 UDP-N-acetylmuramate dehydrogenase [Hahella sp. HNIBRBA332]